MYTVLIWHCCCHLWGNCLWMGMGCYLNLWPLYRSLIYPDRIEETQSQIGLASCDTSLGVSSCFFVKLHLFFCHLEVTALNPCVRMLLHFSVVSFLLLSFVICKCVHFSYCCFHTHSCSMKPTLFSPVFCTYACKQSVTMMYITVQVLAWQICLQNVISSHILGC